jgi:hypothetical protein
MAMSELETMGGSPNPKLQQIQNNYVAAIATVDQIAAALGLTQNKDLGAILEAIADLKDKATKAVECTQFGIEVLKEKVELINAIAVELNLSGDFEDADVLRQVKAERQAKECAMLAAKERGVSLDAIAGYLGFDSFNGELIPIYEAIANLKHSLQLSQNEVDEMREKTVIQQVGEALGFSPTAPFDVETICIAASSILRLKNELQVTVSHQSRRIAELESRTTLPQKNLIAQIEALKAELEAIAKHLLIKFTGDTDEIHAAITELIKYSLRDNDRDELQSERDYYRGILDKLCDRLKVVDIEALEHVAKYQEMSLDFTSQHNDNLAQQLAESQATSYKYVGRIVELENELRSLKELANGLQEKLIATKVMASKRLSRIAELEDKSRSLQEPVNIGCGDDHVDSLRYFVDAFKPNALKNFDSDRLTTPELIQIIRSLLK